MSSTTITIGLVVLALAVGAWILLRGGNDEEEAEGDTPPAPAAPQSPSQRSEPATAASQTSAPATGSASTGSSAGQAVSSTSPSVVPAQDTTRASTSGGPLEGNGRHAAAPPRGPLATAGDDGFGEQVRERWRDLQLRFVDDPQAAAGEAERLVDEALAEVTASLNARKTELSRWRLNGGGSSDTEQLRAVVHDYREFLHQIVGP